MQYDENYDIWDAYYESLPDDWDPDYVGVGDDEPDCECRLCGDQADASDCELHGARRPMGTATTGNAWVLEQVMPHFIVSTPCSCQDGDTRTCFLHGEVA